MSCLIRAVSQFQLTPEKLGVVLKELKCRLEGRTKTAYVFGSAALGNFNVESDIDIILVVEDPKRPFVERGFDFLDLFDVYPKLDILVYTPAELQAQLTDSDIGFWKSVRESMREL